MDQELVSVIASLKSYSDEACGTAQWPVVLCLGLGDDDTNPHHAGRTKIIARSEYNDVISYRCRTTLNRRVSSSTSAKVITGYLLSRA